MTFLSFLEGVVEPCASVRALSSVVPLGSPVTATCEVRDSCLLLGERDVRLEWRLGGRLIPNGLVTNESSGFSQVVIPRFNHTRALLSCQVQGSPSLVVGGVAIRAGCETHFDFLCIFINCSLLINLRSTSLAQQYISEPQH